MKIVCTFVLLSTAMLFAADGVQSRILDADPAAPFVPQTVKVRGATQYGSGTLIDKKFVLTAAHLVQEMTAGEIRVDIFTNKTTVGTTLTVTRIFIHPTWQKDMFEEGFADAALLELSAEHTAIAPAPLHRSAAVAGSSIFIAGYGMTGDGSSGPNASSPRTYSAGRASIDKVLATYFTWAFKPGVSGTAPGDSGGSAYISVGGKNELIGITSYSDNAERKYDTIEGDTQIFPILGWIDATVAGINLRATGTPPVYSGSVRANQSFTVETLVANDGAAQTAPFTVTYRLSTDTEYDDADTLLGEALIAGGVPAKGSASAAWSGKLPAPLPTQFFIVAAIDANSEIFELSETDNRFVNPNPLTSRLNSAPQIGSASYAPQHILSGVPVTFSISSTDADGDTLSIEFDYGDGAITPSNTHTFTAPGTYTVRCSVSDGFGGVAEQPFTLTVTKPITIPRRKFTLNFKAANKDALDLTFKDADFVYASKAAFHASTNGAQVRIGVGDSIIDVLSVLKGKAKSGGSLSWNQKKGELRYKRKKANLRSVLQPFGAVDSSVNAQLAIPVLLELNGKPYGERDTPFEYSAKSGVRGIGR